MVKKRVLNSCLGILLLMQPLSAQVKTETKEADKKLDLKLYGFIKGDMFYANKGVISFGSQSLAAPQIASGIDQHALGFTAQHSRFGLRGIVGEEIKVSGLIEIDFFTNAFDANVKPRIRQAYASVAKNNFEARLGQQWDLFSLNNPNTNNTNSNLWYGGNRGFRRAQIQLSYKMDHDRFSPMIQLSIGETAREESGLGKDNLKAIPMFQGRLSGTIVKKYIVGVSFMNGQFLETAFINPANTKEFTVIASGFCFDFNLPVHQFFSLLGEFSTGTNLNNANIFSISGNHYYSVANEKVTEYDRKSIGCWLNAFSKIRDWFHVSAGYGFDKNNSAAFTINAWEKNSIFFGDLIFPIRHGFSVAMELQRISTTKVTGIDENNKISESEKYNANVISISGRLSF